MKTVKSQFRGEAQEGFSLIQDGGLPALDRFSVDLRGQLLVSVIAMYII
ncbi:MULTISPECIES: hypothetical protein [unclassified Oceanispirochaeta]|nr:MULTISPECIES: hypothetical protein [unclassified Oceanispirochaeta]MBF9014222.1 hypothetical protein [Oceanispirochaeta sp. M2]NPD71108.1 hypothetical protein [Oceanispirochaeta sp. M1]